MFAIAQAKQCRWVKLGMGIERTLAFALVTLLTSRVYADAPTPEQLLARAATPQQRALVAEGKAAEALPLAVQSARDAPSPDRWKLVLVMADWVSKADEALLALEALAKLEPSNRDNRAKLAQRLLWAKRAADALPHVTWLEHNHTLKPTELEVVTWVLLETGHRQRALQAAEQWLRLQPTSVAARWVIADLTHWTARWKTAAAQYVELKKLPAERSKAEERQRLLRDSHPDLWGAEWTQWSDNFGVSFASIQAYSIRQLPGRFQLQTRLSGTRWAETPDSDQDEAKPTINVGRLALMLRYEWRDAWWPELILGMEADTAQNVAGIVDAGLRFSVDGWLFGKVGASYDRLSLSRSAAESDVRQLGGYWEAYAEPRPWLFASTTGEYRSLSDGNQRFRVLGAVGLHNTGALQVEPRIFVENNFFEFVPFNATPYFAPVNPLMFGGDLTLRYRHGDWLFSQIRFGQAYQGNVDALLWGALLRARLGGGFRLAGEFGRIGSAEYNQAQYRLRLEWVE